MLRRASGTFDTWYAPSANPARPPPAPRAAPSGRGLQTARALHKRTRVSIAAILNDWRTLVYRITGVETHICLECGAGRGLAIDVRRAGPRRGDGRQSRRIGQRLTARVSGGWPRIDAVSALTMSRSDYGVVVGADGPDGLDGPVGPVGAELGGTTGTTAGGADSPTCALAVAPTVSGITSVCSALP